MKLSNHEIIRAIECRETDTVYNHADTIIEALLSPRFADMVETLVSRWYDNIRDKIKEEEKQGEEYYRSDEYLSAYYDMLPDMLAYGLEKEQLEEFIGQDISDDEYEHIVEQMVQGYITDQIKVIDTYWNVPECLVSLSMVGDCDWPISEGLQEEIKEYNAIVADIKTASRDIHCDTIEEDDFIYVDGGVYIAYCPNGESILKALDEYRESADG